LALRGCNQWPGGEAKLRRDMMAYLDAMGALCDRMLPPFAVALGMPADYFAPFFTDEAHAVLRFLHYPPQPEGVDNLCGQAPRTDNSFMTALARADVRGLALRLPSITSSGDQSWRKLRMSSGWRSIGYRA
jgi:isopenicillin N synthase-like dioxygenase